ncbi:MAG: type I-C CRISPR-associated protein Cas8c/Csd1 [Ignavibacteriaceae bacterium]
MSWIQKLYETYNNCETSIGYSSEENKRPLLPICHITAQADIEITLDEKGNFITANLITDIEDTTTIIPSTEDSASRSGKKPECHPLSDSLQYLARDFTDYGGTVTSGFSKNPKEPYNNFIKSLTNWCESEYCHPKAIAILNYVKKKSLVKDLVNRKILFIGPDGKLLAKREAKKDKKAPPDIFDIAGSQYDAFIRWIVEKPGDLETRAWKDKSLWESWSKYYLSTKKKEPLCYVIGENALLTSLHPKYIRAKGDGAKIISANDTTDFTFRGRFLGDKEAEKKNFPKNQVCSVSLEVSQKVHNALIWLISKQGKLFWVKGSSGRKEPGLTIVAWATSGKTIPKITDDPLGVIGFDGLQDFVPIEVSTAEDIAIKFKNRMLGYASELGNTDNVVVMSLDSASKGRLAITYYREDLSGSDFLQKIENWHKSCEWIHKYRYKDIQDKETGKRKRYFQPFIGAPAPINIAEASYGEDADDKIKKAIVARLLPCIIDGQPIPRDIVESVVRRASNRVALEDWEWNKTLSIACSLFKKYSKEDFTMALDENRNTRDYLYGRLLAVADKLEGHALSKTKEKRETNAARYMQIFAEHPFKTWRQIELALSSYKARLGGAHYYTGLIDEIMCKFSPDDFNSDKALSGEFLLGYHCQRAELWKKKDEEEPDEE